MYGIILHYTQVGRDDGPAPPVGRLAPRCKEVWAAATLPSGRCEGQQPPKEIPAFCNEACMFVMICDFVTYKKVLGQQNRLTP